MSGIITYDKPFKTHEEQLAILSSRNITIADHDFALKALRGLSYYTLINGYKNTFLSIQGTDMFVEGTRFEDLYTLHTIDTNLNSIILKYILVVEQYLKTRLSYIVSKNYGVYTDTNDFTNRNPSDYLCRNYYRSNGGRNNVLKQLKESLTSDRINDSVAHYANTKNHIPPWILVTNITFGLSIKWYEILKATDRDQLSSEFISDTCLSIEQKKEFLTIALDLLREYRNKIAHGNRTFNVSNLPVLPKNQLLTLTHGNLSEAEYNAGVGKSDVCAVIFACFILIDDRYMLANFLNDLQYVLTPYSGITMNGKTIFEIFRLPDNIFHRLQDIMQKRFFN